MEQNTVVIFADDARKRLVDGLKIAADAVTATMGPQGKTVLIQNGDAVPIITKDGVTVSKSIKLQDPVQRMGAQLICEAASRTNDIAGDGTTTATLLTYNLVMEGLKLMGAGHSSVEIKTGIEKAIKVLVTGLRKIAKPINNRDELVQIATISANGDKQIGELIADAIEKVGRDGIVTVEDAKGLQTTLEVVEGMQVERGYMSPYFVTSNEKMHAVYKDCYVLIADKKLTSFRELVPVLEQVQKFSRPLLIIAEDYEGDSLSGLVLNKMHSQLQVVAIKAPGFGSIKDYLLGDIATLTNAKISSAQSGLPLEKVKITDLGICEKITVDRNSTTIVAKGNTKSQVEERVNNLREQYSTDATLNEEEADILKKRIAKLSSGVAVIRVGGSTEVEMIERKYRIEDALNATRAAVEEGIVPGGGAALIRAELVVRDEFEKNYGSDVVRNICTAPLRKIVDNCGNSADVITEKVQGAYGEASGESIINMPAYGYNLSTNKIVDMFECGIIDPLKVTRIALENAASVASVILSLDAVVYEVITK